MKKIGLKGFIVGLITGSLLMIGGTAVASNVIEAKLYNAKIVVNGQVVALADSPINANGRTYLPVRALSEAIGYEVDFDGTNKVVTLSNGNVTTNNTNGNQTTNEQKETTTTKPSTPSSKGDDVLIEGLLEKAIKYSEGDKKDIHDMDAIKQMIEVDGINVNAKDKATGMSLTAIVAKYSPYYYPARDLRYMIDKGADLFSVDNEGRNLLHQVAYSDNGSYFTLLRDAGVDKKAVDSNGKTPYDIALENDIKHNLHRFKD